jgi:hypothetical protein
LLSPSFYLINTIFFSIWRDHTNSKDKVRDKTLDNDLK